MSLKFGTDGVRGVANSELTPEICFRIGFAAGLWLKAKGGPLRAAMGRDTRRSGSMLGAAVASGLCSAGVDVTAMAVAPTGCVSWVTARGGYGLGIVISASHNPAPDNGVKLLDADGRKLPESVESEIVSLMAFGGARDGQVGMIHSSTEPIQEYMAHLLALVPEGLVGMKVAVDGSNGAAHALGPDVLRQLGATVYTMGDAPDGWNINQDCGATRPHAIQEFTKETGADVGIAFDGDADRAVFCDSRGRLINGDRTMGIWAAHRHDCGELEPAIVVGTVMSNTGFERYLAQHGVELHRTSVGDKYVAARMRESGAKIGGEQSGHLIFADRGVTGDGLITALEFLRVLRQSGRTGADAVDAFENWPQVLVNLKVASKDGWDSNPVVRDAIRDAEAMLQGHGRLNVRPSGTEPKLRVMVESTDAQVRDGAAELVVKAMERELGVIEAKTVDLTHALGD